MENLNLKIKKYQKVLTGYVRNLAKECNSSLGSDQDYHSIIDLTTNHFQFLQMSWKNDDYTYLILIHLTINAETGNIWIQQNNTEIEIDVELEKLADIPKKHFVLGFFPEYVRKHSDYAVA